MNTPHIPKISFRTSHVAGQPQSPEPLSHGAQPQRATLTLRPNAIPRMPMRATAAATPDSTSTRRVALPESARWSAPYGR